MRFATVSIVLFLLVAAVGAGYGLAILTEAIETPWPLQSDSPPATASSLPEAIENRAAMPTVTAQPSAASTNTPATTQVLPTPTTFPTAIPAATTVPTYTPLPTSVPTPTPTPTLVPTPTPVPASAAKLPWVADGIDESERAAFRDLSALTETNPPVGLILLKRPWVIDGVSGPERATIERINNLGYDLPTLAGEIAKMPWLADDVTQPESHVVEYLYWIARTDMALAQQVIEFPWLMDGVTQSESNTIDTLWEIAYYNDVALANRIVNLPWIKDGLDAVEVSIIESLFWIVREDAELANAIANKSWLEEGLSNDAARSVINLDYIQHEDLALAKSIATMPFLETLEPTDTAALEALSWLAYTEILALREVLAHPTLKDGITDEWAPVVALMDSVNEAAPAFLRPLLDPQQTTVERHSVTLPHTGITDLAIIRTSPGVPRSMDLLEHSISSVEKFVGVALPTNYVGLLFGTAVLGYSHGTHYGDYFVMLPEYDADDGSDSANYAGHLMAHEVAHFYWRDNPNWLDEGLAELLAAISENRRTGAPVTVDYTYCPAGDNIALLERLDAAGVIYDYRCNYALGGQFFLELYNSLGDDAFSEGLRNLYLASLVEDYTDEFDGSPVGIRQIQDAFQSHASAVAPIIDKWYHGSSPQ